VTVTGRILLAVGADFCQKARISGKPRADERSVIRRFGAPGRPARSPTGAERDSIVQRSSRDGRAAALSYMCLGDNDANKAQGFSGCRRPSGGGHVERGNRAIPPVRRATGIIIASANRCGIWGMGTRYPARCPGRRPGPREGLQRAVPSERSSAGRSAPPAAPLPAPVTCFRATSAAWPA